MNPIVSSYLKALLTILIGILAAMAVGAFMGTPVDPTQFRQVQAKWEAAVQAGMVFREGEAEAYLAVPNHPDPPFWAAILDWHAWLLAPGLILAFLALRPAVIPALMMSCIAAAFLYYFVAANAAIILLAASLIGMLGVYGLAKARTKAQDLN
jgi:hypothetical protein